MKKIVLSAVTLVVTVVSLAQGTYSFSVANEPYSNLVNSTSLNNGDVWDDPSYTIPLGFDFQISAGSFNTLYIADWTVGGVISSSATGTGISPVLIPVGQDIVSRFDSSGNSISPISYKIDGAPGNRIAKIEWKNFGFSGDSTGDDFMNMQVWLYEGSNKIEYRYGLSSILNFAESFEAETGPTIAFLSSYNIDADVLTDVAYVLIDTPSNPTVVPYGAGENAEIDALEGVMDDGTVYRFEPGVLGVEDFSNPVIALYPNPAKDILTVLAQDLNARVTLYNVLGQQINVQNTGTNTYDVSALQTGVYIAHIKVEGTIVTQKFIKQ